MIGRLPHSPENIEALREGGSGKARIKLAESKKDRPLIILGFRAGPWKRFEIHKVVERPASVTPRSASGGGFDWTRWFDELLAVQVVLRRARHGQHALRRKLDQEDV